MTATIASEGASEMQNGVLPFLMDSGGRKASLRGRLARVDGIASSILARHNYPLAAAELSAESIALAACLSSTMDFDGIFTLQASGNAGISTLFADVTSAGAVRAYAQVTEDFDGEEPLGAPAALIKLMGTGYLAFTVDQGENGRYQGIVPIEEPDLNAVAMRYFYNSEQLDTALLLAAKPDANGGWHAAALMLQRIPETGGNNEPKPFTDEEDDIWHTACTLMATSTREELTDPNISPEELLRRLFQELNVAVLPFKNMMDECRCSPERVERMLDGLEEAEKIDLADDDKKITVSCEFCKKEHHIKI